ncbi:hypothetical protein ATCC90586_007160 [Pythium insidiosum]|nr:hypothetical protein ATCC90586_007160 [Pythium insidiosum]
MNTTEFDDGDFWQLGTPHPHVQRGAIVVLLVVAALFEIIALLPVLLPLWQCRFRRWSAPANDVAPVALTVAVSPGARAQISPTHAAINAQSVSSKPPNAVDSPKEIRIGRFVHVTDAMQEYWAFFMELVEVILQLVTLHDLLRLGERLPLLYAYVALMLLNCLSCFYVFSVGRLRSRQLSRHLIDACLDTCFAVGFPVAQFVYGVRSFRGDLRLMRLRQKFFPAQPFERRGRIYSDPVQINRFIATLAAVRFSTWRDVLVRGLFSLITCMRWRNLVTVMLHRHRLGKRRLVAPTSSPTRSQVTDSTANQPGSKQASAVRSGPLRSQSSRVIPSRVGFAFLLLGALVAGFVHQAVTYSNELCAPHATQCVLHAHRWIPVGSSASCPCLVFIDQLLTASLNERSAPVDVSANLSQLADAGALRTIQIVNRRLVKLPRLVLQCSDLRELILVNSGLNELPASMGAAFPSLEYIHIEGSELIQSLERVPSSAFDGLTQVRTMVLTRHTDLMELPRMASLVAVEAIQFSSLTGLRRLPSISALTRLRSLALTDMRQLVTLPDLSVHSASLQALFIQRSALCCNGFMTSGIVNMRQAPCSTECQAPGVCFDSADPTFQLLQWSLPDAATSASLQRLNATGSVCALDSTSLKHRKISTIFCDGVLYRQCRSGICYSDGFELPSCWNDSSIVAMRREMITAGLPCDPSEEAWLGCASSP